MLNTTNGLFSIDYSLLHFPPKSNQHEHRIGKKNSVAPSHYACSCNKFIYFSITFATKRNNTSHGITKKYHTEVVQKESITQRFKYAAFLRYLNRIVSTSFCKWTLPTDHPQCYIPCDHKRTPEFPNLCSILHDEKLEKKFFKRNPTTVKPELSHLKRTVWPLNLKAGKQKFRSGKDQKVL